MAAMLLQTGLDNFGPVDFFCDGLQLAHFVHQVVDIACIDLEIRFVPEARVGAFKEMEPGFFLNCCSDKDLVHIWQVETEKRQRLIEIVTAVSKTGDGLRQHTQELLSGLVQAKSSHTELSVL